MKTYHGVRTPLNCMVFVTCKLYGISARYCLPPRLELRNHSPSGFDWGYGGSGPAQLALALVADVLDDDSEAVKLHQEFKWQFVAGLARDETWEITEDQIQEMLNKIRSSIFAEEKSP